MLDLGTFLVRSSVRYAASVRKPLFAAVFALNDRWHSGFTLYSHFFITLVLSPTAKCKVAIKASPPPNHPVIASGTTFTTFILSLKKLLRRALFQNVRLTTFQHFSFHLVNDIQMENIQIGKICGCHLQ